MSGGPRSLEICKRAGVPVAYGTDLLGQLQTDRCREFELRSPVLSPIAIDGDPLQDLGIFQRADTSLLAIMRGGRFHKHRLN